MLPAIEKHFYMKIIVTIIAIDLVTNSLLSFYVILQKPKTGIQFSTVGGLATKNISSFCLQQAVICFKPMSNYMNFNKSISPRVNPVRSSMVSLVNQSSISRNFRSATLNGYS